MEEIKVEVTDKYDGFIEDCEKQAGFAQMKSITFMVIIGAVLICGVNAI